MIIYPFSMNILVMPLFCNQMGILSIDLNNINLDDTNCDQDNP